ncbi:alpha/beta-hydrolase, partial [Heliocybe sulcata]
APSAKSLRLQFTYTPSDDGTDENLLIFLHGLGDTLRPFTALARSLKLPQTACLVLQAPAQIPLLDAPAFQWYPSFDVLTGDRLAHPDPSPALDALDNVLDVLMRECGWRPARVHLFGFAQGGSVALEVALRWWKARKTPLASVVSICGPLLSFPSTGTEKCPTPVLYFHRPQPFSAPSKDVSFLGKAFSSVKELQHAGGGEAMPRSRDEWEGVMRFWSERLSRRQFRAGEAGVYEVLSG